MARGSLEVHEHCIISGPNANKEWLSKFAHSHEGGDKPHVHDDGVHSTGPAAYTIDKDEWFARTGMRGGGRKKFTAKASGQQMPLVPTERSKIQIVIVGDGGAEAAGPGCSGPGLAPVDRMILTFGDEVESVTHYPTDGGRARRIA